MTDPALRRRKGETPREHEKRLIRQFPPDFRHRTDIDGHGNTAERPLPVNRPDSK